MSESKPKPRTFTDTEGRVWTVRVTYGDAKRVKQLLDLDILSLPDEGVEVIAKFLGNVLQFIDVVYVLVKPQADALGVSDEQFGQSMSGDSLRAAREAFYGALADFSPAQLREVLLGIQEQGAKIQTAMCQQAMEAMKSFDADAAVKSLVSSGNSPGSPDSIRTPSPSAN